MGTSITNIAFAIVTYREQYSQTVTYKSLVKAVEKSGFKIALLIYDNTDLANWNVDHSSVHSNIQVSYTHNPKNPGISQAYNFLAGEAERSGAEWIVILDQDTLLTPDCIQVYFDAIKEEPDVYLKAPILRVKDYIFSPSIVVLKRCIILKKIKSGILQLKKYAIVNSGLAINIDFFFKIGGYNPKIKLDFADHQFIDKAKKHTNKYQLLPISFKHDFSHEHRDITAALNRYRIFVKDLSAVEKYTISDHIGYFFVGILHLVKLTLRFKSVKFFTIQIKQALI